ncbi:hypothetical protein N7478_003799 [Penicillium angulare]|uniref:uncharacterized protein n=1 Tax=Penicillium angulare TaxID=116970 RepID=UPI002541CB8A|nr:uncharacterized protein N7478_003799 [Penicillium angulare]KAJ5288113.1 hypothetical protein N7478_003799 [Penicillium angulare]
MSLPYVDVYQKDGLNTAPARGMGTGIVLRSSAQWRTWYSQIRSSAKSNDVWEYIDPDTLQPPEYPRKPRKPQPSDVQEDALYPEDLDEANDAKLHRLLKHYDRSILEYSTLNRALDRVMERICNTLASEHQAVIAEIEDPRTLLCSLRDRFSPAEGERKIELYLQWGRLLRSSPKNSQVDSWLNEWENLYTEAVSAGVPNVKDHQIVSYEFLAAIRPLDESFHGIWYEKLFHDPSSKVFFTYVMDRRKLAYSTSTQRIRIEVNKVKRKHHDVSVASTTSSMHARTWLKLLDQQVGNRT